MRLRNNVCLGVSLAALAASFVAPGTAGHATTGGSKGIAIDVVPKHDLEDVQQVTVTVRGFRPRQVIGVQQCPSPPGPNTEPPFTAQDCDPDADSSAGRSDYQEGTADADGSFTVRFSARRRIQAADGGALDCARRQCAVAAFPADDVTDEYAYDDISFRP
jgi:hypothetical protein